MRLVIKEDKEEKRVASESYNYYLNKKTGYFARWGKTLADDPTVGPAPEILDLEISTSIQPHEQHLYPSDRICSEGGCKGNCKDWCYKSNAYNLPVYNMSFEEFKNIFHKMPRTLVSIAFGIMNIDTNPDFFKMARYAREHGVMPTFTMHGLDDISDETIEEIKSLFGACAISLYNKERSYNLIKRLTDAGMDQVNIHFLLAEQTYEKALSVMEDMKTDERLKKLNALVFLSLKQKGNAVDC